MKKILAVILSLAMILSMTVCGFAAEVGEEDTTIENGEVVEGGEVAEGDDVVEDETTEPDGSKPADADDVAAWTAYYTVLLTDVTTNPAAVATVVPEIAATVSEGEISLNAFKTAFPEAAKLVGGDLVNQVVWGVETLLSMDLNSDSYIGQPDGSLEEDGQLPDDGTEDGGLLGGFDITDLLNTVLGFLGSIGDLLFGGDSGSDTPSDDSSEDDPWGDDDNFGDNGSTIPDTGDTTVFAVAAVALAAGAALVMTRKKSEDAE